MRMLDLFCGRFGWSRAFAARGWECVGIDLVEPPEIPHNCTFVQADILTLNWRTLDAYIDWDFICASPPCQEFSIHGMKHFHPNAKYPTMAVKLFEHTRQICGFSRVRYVIENVRAAQQFVGDAVNHVGPFYLWGNGVPPILPQGIKKGIDWPRPGENGKRDYRKAYNWTSSKGQARIDATAKVATIPPELANCVCDYAEAICGKAITA